MALSLPAGHTLRYNGITFGSFTKTLSVRVKPIPDASNRTTIVNEYTFTFRSTVAGGATDAAVVACRRALTKNGGVFIYTGRGLGDIAINTGIVRDVMWGPWVTDVLFEPLAEDNAVRITWTIQVRIPECPGAKYKFAWMELAYTVTHDIDKYGCTTWTAAGHLRIPQNWSGNANRLLNDSPDDYREAQNPPLTMGFRRTYGPWVVSEDRTRLDFEIKDEEMGLNYPPPGVVDVKASHEFSSNGVAAHRWTGTISAEYELARGTPPAVAADHFYSVLVKNRINNAKKLAMLNNIKGAAGVMPLAHSIGEPEIYGKIVKVKLSLTYQFLYDITGPGSPLAISGLWQPVPLSNWLAWSTSLKGTAMNPRGNVRFTFKLTDDVFDLCNQPESRTEYIPGKVNNVLTPVVPVSTAPQKVPAIKSLWEEPTAAASWANYENVIYLEADSGSVPVRTLPSKKEHKGLTGAAPRYENATQFVNGQPVKFKIDNLKQFQGQAANVVAPFAGDFAANTNAVAQIALFGAKAIDKVAAMVRSRQLVYVYLRGSATRWGYPVPCPSLTDVNGLVPVLACRLNRGEGFSQGIAGSAAGTPIYTATWNLRYQLPDVPKGSLPIPPNPFQGGA